MMRTIENTVKYIRSKNAGPFWLTIDAFCNSVEDTEKVAAAFEREKEFIAKSYHVIPEDLEIYCCPPCISLSSRLPSTGTLGRLILATWICFRQ